MTKAGTPYELLTQQIFQDILDQSDVKTIEVQHDVTIQGRSTVHQIDVYWKFELNGLEYATVVQAKDWASAVDQGKLLQFKAVLDDIPGQPKGVFVTRTGYQDGAKRYAAEHGIDLFELRSPTDADYEGRVRTIRLKIRVVSPRVTGFRPKIDNDWIESERSRLAIPEEEAVFVSLAGPPEEFILYDDAHQPVRTIADEFGRQFGLDSQPCDTAKHEILFTAPLYMQTGVPHFPWIKILGYRVNVEVDAFDEEIVIHADDIVGFILKTLSDNSVRTFGKDGSGISRP